MDLPLFLSAFLATQHGYCHHEHLKNGTFININTTWDLAELGIFTAQVASSSLFNGKACLTLILAGALGLRSGICIHSIDTIMEVISQLLGERSHVKYNLDLLKDPHI